MKRSTKKYKRAVNVTDCVGNALSAMTVAAAVSGVALLSTIAAMPAGIALESIAAVYGSVMMAGRVMSRRLNKKAKKHDNIRQSAETVLRSISQITCRALDDGVVSDSEYQLVLDEVELFAEQKEEIRDQTMQALEQFAWDQDGRVDGDSTAPLEAAL